MEIDAEGSCLCRAIRFAVKGRAQRFYTCHCTRCQKVSGSAFASNIFVDLDAVTWIAGRHHAVRFEFDEAEHFCSDFCNKCGCRLPYLSRNRQFYIIPAGALDHDPGVRPTARIFWDDRAPWLEEALNCPSFQGYWSQV